MSDSTITATPRSVEETGSGPAGRLRRAGRVPAVVYGLGTEPEAISVDALELNRILHSETGSNTLITLDVTGGAQHLTLARQVHRHPTKGHLIHVDFVKINRNVAVTADIPVHIVGEAEGVKNGGILEQPTQVATIEAKPGDIPTEIEHDISALEIGESARLGDLVMPAGVTLLSDPEEVIAIVHAPRVSASDEGEEGEAAEGDAAAGDAAE